MHIVDPNDNGERDSNGTRVNWDNEVVPNEPWINRELFKLGDYSVTGKDVVVGSSTTLIIVLVSVAICLFVAYRKRKRIVIEAKRASFALRKASHNVRRSIKMKMGGQDIGDFQEEF